VLGAIHQRWRAVPGRFKDYISQPKSNGYRSIHTTVSGRDGKQVEVQIRTRQMHEVAETGVAAHWSYRDGVRAQNPFAVDPAKWIGSLTERFDDRRGPRRVSRAREARDVFRPGLLLHAQGRRGEAAEGATPMDFAYAIHTRIGHACVGAKVDGMRVPLWTRLKNGQSVEIITAEGQTPQATWLDIATTGRAKAAIRRALREVDRERYIKLGRELARVAFENSRQARHRKGAETAAKMLRFEDADEVLARLRQRRDCPRVRCRRCRSIPEVGHDESRAPRSRPAARCRPPPGGQTFERAQCCQPVAGRADRRDHLSAARAPIVHAIDCEALADFDDQPALARPALADGSHRRSTM
jgi:guanosine-3',5'-bis(diphosphate) 3'-pyrophosphohydrolase